MQAFNPDRRGASVATTQTGQGVSILDAAFGRLEVQAEVVRDLTSSYASAARTLLK